MAGFKKSASPAATSAAPRAGLIGSFLRGNGVGSFVVVALLLGGGVWTIWQNVRETVVSRADYQIGLADIELTPLPAWIRSDLKAEALRNASLDPPLPLLDEQLPARLERAFAMHPWIEKVQAVRIGYPAKVQIDVAYRRPVVMVEVASGLMPLDATGILLPTVDFTPLDTRKYPRLAGIDGAPLAPAGAVWNDPIVLGGAVLANELRELWKAGDLYCLRWVRDPAGTHDWERHFVLETRPGTRIVWGDPPGRTQSDEPTLAEKRKALAGWITAPGGLESALKGFTVDLRNPATWPK